MFSDLTFFGTIIEWLIPLIKINAYEKDYYVRSFFGLEF